MSAPRTVLLCFAALLPLLMLLLPPVQGYSIRPLARVKRGCLAGQQSMTEGSDHTTKENMYQKMFHNAFSRFLEAMVRCSEDYAKNKKVTNCFDGQIDDGKKETQEPAKLVREEDESSSSLIVNLAKPSSGMDSDSTAKKKMSADYLVNPPSFTEEHNDFPNNKAYSKHEYSGAESKVSSQVAEPIGDYSEKQSVIQQASTESAVSQGNQSDSENVESNATYIPPNSHTDPTQETSTDLNHYKQTNDAVIENAEQPQSETVQESLEEKTTEINYEHHQNDKNSEMESKSTYEYEGKFLPSTESTNVNVLQSNDRSVDVVEKDPESSQGEKTSHITQGTTQHPDGTVPEQELKLSSPHTSPDDSKGSDTTTEAMQLAMSELNENMNEQKTPVYVHEGSTDVVGYEETTTRGFKTSSTVLHIAESGEDGSELNNVHVENIQPDMTLESDSQEQSDKNAITSDEARDNKTTDPTQEPQPETYTDSPPTDKNQQKERYETTTAVTYMHKSSETTPQEQVESTISSDIHEQQKSETNETREPEYTTQQYENSQIESEASVKVKHGVTGHDTSTTEESYSSQHQETQVTEHESEHLEALNSIEYTTSEAPKENETFSHDSSAVATQEEQNHTTPENVSLPPLPYESSTTKLYPNLKFNEVSDKFRGKPIDRFGRESAVLAEASNPDNGYLPAASLRSEEVYNPNNSGSISAPSDELQSEAVFPDSSTQNLDLDDTMEKPAKLDCKCHITEEFIKQLKQGRWKTLLFEIRPQ